MEWEAITWRAGHMALGKEYAYLVVIEPEGPGVVLTRFQKACLDRPYLHMKAIAHATASSIQFPLGRAGGRPALPTEIEALVESAKTWAERFEADGADFGALGWRTGQSSEPRVTMAELRRDSFEADDRAAVARVQSFTGHIEDMTEDERLYLLGYLAGALSRRLGSGEADPNAGRCCGPEGCYPWERDRCPAFRLGECSP